MHLRSESRDSHHVILINALAVSITWSNAHTRIRAAAIIIIIMSSYVVVSSKEDGKEDDKPVVVELPTEPDGTLMLSVVQSQFEGATGLKYK